MIGLTESVPHVPVWLDVVGSQGDLPDVAEPWAVDVGKGVPDVAANGSEFFLAWKNISKINLMQYWV